MVFVIVEIDITDSILDIPLFFQGDVAVIVESILSLVLVAFIGVSRFPGNIDRIELNLGIFLIEVVEPGLDMALHRIAAIAVVFVEKDDEAILVIADREAILIFSDGFAGFIGSIEFFVQLFVSDSMRREEGGFAIVDPSGNAFDSIRNSNNNTDNKSDNK